MINRRSLLLGSLAVSAAGLAACAQPTPVASGNNDLTVGLTYIPNVQFSAFYLGLQEGLFAARGLNVTLRHHGQQEDLFGALLGGQEDVVFASADEAMVAAANGQDLRTFATSYQQYPVHVLGGDPAQESEGLAILRGATLGIPGRFGSSYYAALGALHRADLTENDVELVDIGYTAISALASGNVDFVMGFVNNEEVQLETQGIAAASLPVVDPAAPALVGPSLITAGTTVHSDVLRELASALKEAEEAVVADPGAALDATVEYVPALAEPEQRAAAEKVLAATTKLWMRDGEVSVAVNEEAFDRMGQFLTEVGIISAPPQTPVTVVV